MPLWWNYRDRDLGVHAWAIAPLFYTSDSPAGHDWLTPLIGHFETYGESQTWWIFPTLTLSSDRHGWDDDFHPIVYIGRSDDSSHTVLAPIFWDFANPKGRSTVGFPLYWRFADTSDDSVTQVAANTLYMQKRVAGGTRLAVPPARRSSRTASTPSGYFWNILFGLAGYSRDGASSQVRALWVPFNFGAAPPRAQAVDRAVGGRHLTRPGTGARFLISGGLRASETACGAGGWDRTRAVSSAIARPKSRNGHPSPGALRDDPGRSRRRDFVECGRRPNRGQRAHVVPALSLVT